MSRPIKDIVFLTMCSSRREILTSQIHLLKLLVIFHHLSEFEQIMVCALRKDSSLTFEAFPFLPAGPIAKMLSSGLAFAWPVPGLP